MIINKKFQNFVRHKDGIYSSKHDFILSRCPTKNEFESFLCDTVPKIQTMYFYINEAFNTPPLWHAEFLKIITDLAVKYRPWHFKWCAQESGCINIDWIEIIEWCYKYKNKTGFKNEI